MRDNCSKYYILRDKQVFRQSDLLVSPVRSRQVYSTFPNGYETKVAPKETGLDSDLELDCPDYGLAKKPDYLLINCHLQAFGRNYIDIIESLVKYGTTEMGLVISADSRVLKKFSNAESSIKILEKQVGGR